MGLTPKNMEILNYIRQGYGQKDICRMMDISKKEFTKNILPAIYKHTGKTNMRDVANS